MRCLFWTAKGHAHDDVQMREPALERDGVRYMLTNGAVVLCALCCAELEHLARLTGRR